MKKCPFCAEEIQDDAIKCRFCNEFLDGQQEPNKKKLRWFFTKPALIIGFMCVGPLMLPFVWFHPRFSLTIKLIITIIAILITWGLMRATTCSVNYIKDYYSLVPGF